MLYELPMRPPIAASSLFLPFVITVTETFNFLVISQLKIKCKLLHAQLYLYWKSCAIKKLFFPSSSQNRNCLHGI